VFWADNRSSAGNGRQVFMQRFDADGNPVLAADGVLAMQCNGNLNGFPRAITAEDNSHIVAMVIGANLAGGTAGFRVGRVTNAGTNLWSDTTRFCTPQLGPNAGTDFAMTSDGDGGVMATWFNWETNSVYAARLDRWGRMGDFTGVEELERSTLSLFPNPATEQVTIQSRLNEPMGSLRIISSEGKVVRMVRANNGSTMTIDVSDLAPGLYRIVSETLQRATFIKQ
jgi:hypothetical protein